MPSLYFLQLTVIALMKVFMVLSTYDSSYFVTCNIDKAESVAVCS